MAEFEYLTQIIKYIRNMGKKGYLQVVFQYKMQNTQKVRKCTSRTKFLFSTWKKKTKEIYVSDGKSGKSGNSPKRREAGKEKPYRKYTGNVMFQTRKKSIDNYGNTTK